MRRSKGPHKRILGFSLVELLICLSIIGILTVVSVPVLLQQRIIANQTAAIGGLRTILAAEIDYFNNSSPHNFTGDLNVLGSGQTPYIDQALAAGKKQGYIFTLGVQPLNVGGVDALWSAEAHPIAYRRTGVLSFFVDEVGLIRGQDILGAPGHANLPAID